METWKSVKGYEGFYEVSNFGRIRSLTKKVRFIHAVSKEEHYRTVEGMVLSPQNTNNGYAVVYLSKNGIRKRAYIHRLVAESFLDLPDGLVVDHIDFNRSNNCISNLRCVSQKENVNAAIYRMRKPRTRCKPSNTGEKYISRRKDGSYRFSVGKTVCKSFKTLDAAIAEKEVFFGGKKFIAG